MEHIKGKIKRHGDRMRSPTCGREVLFEETMVKTFSDLKKEKCDSSYWKRT